MHGEQNFWFFQQPNRGNAERSLNPERRKTSLKPSRRGHSDMQAFVPLHLVTVGVGVAWLVRSLTVNSTPKSRAPEPADAAPDESKDVDLEQSATQWLARSGTDHRSPRSPAVVVARPSSYAELELLADGDFVYLRLGGNVLTALVPLVRHLSLQPLQLIKGNPDAIPTAPLEAISVWLVRRWKQQVAFELLGPHDRRHLLEADPGAPHGVSLGAGSPGKRGRWLITPQGLASARYPDQILPLQVLTVQLFDSRAVKSVRDGLGLKLAELGAKLRHEERSRAESEVERGRLEAALKRVRNETETQIAALRAQLEAALVARHTAERQVAALHAQKADEAARTKMAMARVAQAEFEAQQVEATVRRQQQQIQGMLAGHAEELRTLQQELQIAREANEGLQRAMREQNMSLKGALELRDARILELEEENDRMDTVLQVIQAQLGGGIAMPGGHISSDPDVPSCEPPVGAVDAFGTVPEALDDDVAAAIAAVATAEGAALGVTGPGASEPGEELNLSFSAAAAQPVDEPPLWRSLLDLTGDLSVTALKESLAISRRNTAEDAPMPQWPCDVLPPAVGAGAVPVCRHGSVADEAGPGAGDWGSGGGGTGVDEEEFVSAADRLAGRLRPPSAAVTPMKQQPQVPGAGADAAARGSSLGGPVDLAAAAAKADLDGVAPGGAATAAGPGCSPADLEYGMEATLTLDSLKRRMRQLEAERERLELLKVSLEGSLPWRVRMSTGGGAVSCSSRLAFCTESNGRPGAGLGSIDGADGVSVTALKAVTEEDQRDQEEEAEGERQVDQHKHSRRRQVTANVVQRQQSEQKQQILVAVGADADEVLGSRPVHGSVGAKQPAEIWRALEQQQQAAEQRGAESSSSGLGVHLLEAMEKGVHSGPSAHSCTSAPEWIVTGQQRQTYGRIIAATSAAVNNRPITGSADGSNGSGSSSGGSSSPEQGTRVRCITEQLLHRSGSGCGTPKGSPSTNCVGLLGGASFAAVHTTTWSRPCASTASAAMAPAVDAEGSTGSSSCCSMGGLSGEGSVHRRLETEGSEEMRAVAPAPAAPAFGVVGAARAELPCCVPGGAAEAADGSTTAPVAQGAGGLIAAHGAPLPRPIAFGSATLPGAAGPIGPRVPGLIIGGSPAADFPYGVFDSIDGMCNLGSTRLPPNALAGGWQTARRVAHSRQPSTGVTVDAQPSGLAAPPTVTATASCSPGPMVTPRQAFGIMPAVATATPTSLKGGVTTPMSCASTTGGAEFDEGLVHCDEQEMSPPPAMLLGPLAQLRGAAAAAVAAMAPSSSASGSGRVRSALFDDDEED